jgi:hypothetical protein
MALREAFSQFRVKMIGKPKPLVVYIPLRGRISPEMYAVTSYRTYNLK